MCAELRPFFSKYDSDLTSVLVLVFVWTTEKIHYCLQTDDLLLLGCLFLPGAAFNMLKVIYHFESVFTEVVLLHK